VAEKHPSRLHRGEYKEFYRESIQDLQGTRFFYIHINADYPLNFQEVLTSRALQRLRGNGGQVKLYYNQVLVRPTNIKEVIPEYFHMLKGVLDCPELPLNGSRSYLQTKHLRFKSFPRISSKKWRTSSARSARTSGKNTRGYGKTFPPSWNIPVCGIESSTTA
jgi:HSP90 family molecular chaperone